MIAVFTFVHIDKIINKFYKLDLYCEKNIDDHDILEFKNAYGKSITKSNIPILIFLLNSGVLMKE